MSCNRIGLLINWCRKQIEAMHQIFQVQIFACLSKYHEIYLRQYQGVCKFSKNFKLQLLQNNILANCTNELRIQSCYTGTYFALLRNLHLTE